MSETGECGGAVGALTLVVFVRSDVELFAGMTDGTEGWQRQRGVQKSQERCDS